MPAMNKITTFLSAIAFSIIAFQTQAQAADTNSNLTIDTVQSTLTSTLKLSDVVIGPANTVTNPSVYLKDVAQSLVTEQFGTGQFAAFDQIVSHESGWNPNAVNASSGACGLGQALPCSKITDHSPIGQLKWTIAYIADRYGTPANAWSIWQKQNWY